MSKPLKVFIVVITTLVLLLVGVAILIKVVVTPEKVRDTLLPLAESSLQRTVELGEIDIGIFSGVKVSALKVQKKETAGEFLSVKTLALHYKLLPLLSGNVVIDQILLEKPTIEVIRLKNGDFNFSDLITTNNGQESTKVQKDDNSSSSAAPLDLLVNEISVKGGQVVFIDHANGQQPTTLKLENINLLLKRFTLDGDFPLELSALINGSGLDVSGNYDIARQAGDLDVQLSPLKLSDFSAYYKDALPGRLDSADLSLDLEVQLQPQLVESRGKVQLANLDLILDALPDAELIKADLKLDYSISFDMAKNILGLSTLLVNLNGVSVGAEGEIGLQGKEPEIAMAILLNKFDLNNLLQGLPGGLTKDFQQYAPKGVVDGRINLSGVPSSGPEMLHSADIFLDKVTAKIDNLEPVITGKLIYSDQKVTAEKVIVSVAEQQININLMAENLFGDIIKGDFTVSADQLDLNQLLPQAASEEKEPVAKRQPTLSDEIGPFDIPVDMKGTLQVGKLIYKQLNLDKVRADLTLKDNLLKVEKLRSGVAGGEFIATSEVDLGVKGLKYKGEMSLDQSNLLSLVTAFVPEAQQSVSGLLQWKNNFSGRGTIPDNLLKSLQLKGIMQLQNGKIADSPLLKQLAIFLGAPDLEILDFDVFESSYDLRDGLANLSGQLNSSQANFSPQGTVGVDGSLDMKLDTRIAPELMKKLGVKTGLQNTLSDENGWGILPLALKGSLTNPKVAFDTKALQKQATSKVKEEATKRLLDKIAPKDSGTQEPVKQLLEGTLNKLFGN